MALYKQVKKDLIAHKQELIEKTYLHTNADIFDVVWNNSQTQIQQKTILNQLKTV